MKKTLLLLGANSDIAKSTLTPFAKDGYNIQLALRYSDRLKREKDDLVIRHEIEVSLHDFDLLDLDSHAEFMRGLDPLPDVVILAAGVLGDQETAEGDRSERNLILMSNFNGAVSILSEIANAMEKRGSGTIVGISSVAGDRGRASNYYYGAAKAGLTAYLSGLRNRLNKKGITVITINPGFVKTKMTHDLKLPPLITAKPDQVGRAIYKAVRKKRGTVIYTLGVWRYIMLVIKLIPERIFQKLSL